MGCVQFLEEHDLWCGDMQSSRHFQFNFNNSDPKELPIMTENEEENTDTRQTQKGTSNPTNYRKISQKDYNNINTKRSRGKARNRNPISEDSLYHSMTQSQRNIHQIDYYHLSRKIFDSLNDVRIKPDAYQSLFSGLDETCDSRYKNIKDIIDECNRNSINTLNNNKEIQLIQQHLSQNKKGSVILWNETVYSTVLTHLQYLQPNEDSSSIAMKSDELSLLINSKLKGKFACFFCDLIGPCSTDLCFWNLIYNNTDKLKELCINRYHSGAICCIPMKANDKIRTVLVLINKSNNNGNSDNNIDNIMNNIDCNANQHVDVILFNNQAITDLLEDERIKASDFLSDESSMLFQFDNEELKKK